MPFEPNPDWTAPRSGHDWRDEETLRATSWLKSFVKKHDIDRRLEKAKQNLLAAQEAWGRGELCQPYDAKDTIAWYVFQAEDYATDRKHWIPKEAAAIVPLMHRLGIDITQLQSIPGIDERMARMMNADRSQPQGALFECLVANAYKSKGWPTVEFVPETPGKGKTPDLVVSRPRSRWAVECKKMAVSVYARNEVDQVNRLSGNAHKLAFENDQSVIIEVIFQDELSSIPEDYLSQHVANFFRNPRVSAWSDEYSIGHVREIDWHLIRKVMASDYVYYGDSRMIELLVGKFNHQFEHNMAAKWRPAPTKPNYADAVYQASVVSWQSRSSAAMTRKARHFRSVVAKAADQLSNDCPGVIHIGIDARNGMAVEARRHLMNMLETREFLPGKSRLRWIYGNILAPELTTRRNESWAINETMVPYKIGRHSTKHPLPGHLLLTPEEVGRPGVFWDERQN